MKPKIDYNKKYTIFDRVKFEMLNWTGYNADLLDELVESGNQLIEENENLKLGKYPPDYKEILLNCLGIAIIIAITGWVVIGFGHMVKTDYSKFEIGYKVGQIDALTNERVVYEKTSRGWTPSEFYTKEYGTKNKPKKHFEIVEDGETYYFYLEE